MTNTDRFNRIATAALIAAARFLFGSPVGLIATSAIVFYLGLTGPAFLLAAVGVLWGGNRPRIRRIARNFR